MTASPIFHGAFVIERRYPAPPARVFAAWTDAELKARWFVGPDGWSQIERTLDVREGGSEKLHGRFAGPSGRETLFTARYHQVVQDRRLAYVYDMHVGANHHSVSLATVEFIPDGGGTLQRFHEQVAFLDGTTADQGVPSREHGTAAHLDRMRGLFE